MAADRNNQDARPQSVAIGDFNNDTILDIVVANSNTESIGVFLGFNNGTFRSQTMYSTSLGSRPTSVAVADFNNDHRLDIVVTNYGTHTIGLFLGYNNGSFTNQTTLSTDASRPLMVTVGDIDGDHNTDLAVVNYGTHSVTIYLGQGNGNFIRQTTYWTGYDSYPLFVTLADLNHDNYLDMIIVNYGTDNIIVFLGNNNGSFTNQHIYSTGAGSHPCSVVIGDLNKDNNFDAIVANAGTGSIKMFLGTGTGTFTEKEEMIVTNISSSLHMVAADMNNDKRLDIAIANNGDNTICIILGDNNGSFAYRRIYSTGFGSYPSSIGVGDFNGDQRLDIVITNNGTNNIGIFLSYDPGAFEDPKLYSTDASPRAIAIGDFNKDNKTDIVVVNSHADSIGVFLGFADGTFTNQTKYSTVAGSFPLFVAIGDFNNDDAMDLVVTNYEAKNVGIFLGESNGTFADMMIVLSDETVTYVSVAVADFNNDHFQDLVISKDFATDLSILLGYGNGSFKNQTIYITENMTEPQRIAVADMNNDKQLDIIVADAFANTFGIFYGFGNGSFRNLTIYSSRYGISASALSIADLNDDGQLDIVIAYYISNNIGIFFGHQNETFTNQAMYSTGSDSRPYAVSVSDLNNDYILDIVVTNYETDTLGIFTGLANGMFADQLTLSTGNNSSPWALVINDFNNDNRSDLALTYSSNDHLAILLGYDFATVQNQMTYTTGAASHPISIAVVDLNHDTLLDVVIINYGSEKIDVQLGYHNGVFSKEKTYSVGSGSLPTSMVLGDFNHDAAIDIVTANLGTDSISVFYGYSDGNFALKTTCSTGPGSHPSSLAVVDLNNDTWLDIVVANSGTNNIGIFLGYKYTAFSQQKTYSTEVYSLPSAVVVGDFNNDNRLDIATSTAGQTTGSVFLGDGNGSFTSPLVFTIETYAEAQLIAVAHFNNDQCLDIVTVNIYQGFFSIFIGQCNGTFRHVTTYSMGEQSYPTAIVVSDFNNDNVSDIALTVSSLEEISIYLGYGNGTFVNQTTCSTSSGSNPNSLTTGDFNNDNFVDIAVTNSNTSSMSIFFGQGNGTFTSPQTYSTGLGSNPNMIAVGDFNNDTRLDILIIDMTTNQIGVFFARINGNFSEQIKYLINLVDIPSSIVVYDFNNDSHLDLAITSAMSSTLRIYFGNDHQSFDIGTVYSTGEQSSVLSLAVGDFNGDGQKDIVVANYATSNVGVFLGYCCEPFVSQLTYSTGNNSSPQSVAVGDFNNDTQVDIVVANSNTDNIGIFLGFHNGSFSDQRLFSTGNGSYPISIAVGDFNNDYHLDIIVADYGQETIGILLGYGNGSFAPIGIYYLGIGSRPYSVTAIDLNKDSRLDIVVIDDGTNNVSIFYGDAHGNFGKVTKFDTGYASQPTAVAFGNFNNDTQEDIIVTLAGSNNIGFIVRLC